MKLPEPLAWVHKNDFGRLMFSSSPTVPPWSFPVFTEAQLREALAHQADELKQLQDQNTALDAKLASHEAVMRQALEALEVHCSFAKRDGPCAMEDGITAINAIQDILK